MKKIKKDKYDKEKSKELLKQRKDVRCDCKKKKHNNDRMKYGTCLCDGFSFSYTIGLVLSNALYQYIANGSETIKRDDWATIEKHADAIRDYAEADVWDKITTIDFDGKTATDLMCDYDKKEKAWREAMFWLTENWMSLWW